MSNNFIRASLASVLLVSLAACGGQQQSLPNVTAQSQYKGANGARPPAAPQTNDDPCAGGTDTVCANPGGGSGNIGSTSSDNVPGANHPGGKPLTRRPVPRLDDPCAGGNDTVCGGGTGGGGTIGTTGSDDVPGANHPGGCPLAVRRGPVAMGCGHGKDPGDSNDVSYSGGPAVAGDNCWSSPGTIGAFIGNQGNEGNIYNITQLLGQTSNGYILMGWLYTNAAGQQYFQNYPGTSVGISAGAIVSVSGSTDLSTSITPVTALSTTVFNVGMHAINIASLHTTIKPFSRGCFTAKWNGKAHA